MSPRLPGRAYSVLAESEFMKLDAPVVKRLLNCQDSGFIKAFWHIDKNIKNSFCSEGSAWAIFLKILVEYSTDYTKENKNKINEAKQDYEKKLAEISEMAKALSRQIRAAELLAKRHGFSVDADYHPFALLKNAADNQADAETSYRFNNRIAGGLDDARKEFYLKYFPSIPNVIDEISSQYSTGCFISEDAMTPKRVGKINFFCMHFFKAIDLQIELCRLPSTILDITEQELADVWRVSLGDESIGVQDLKNFKQSQKGKKFI